MKIKAVGFFSALLWGGMVCTVSAGTNTGPRALLNDHEPNLLLYTKDNDDQPFLDFKLSLEYPFMHAMFDNIISSQGYPSFMKKLCANRFTSDCYPYFAFTGRFGQYIGQRDSSPVIAKRFNPKLFMRFRFNQSDNYVDLEYAHESNGQRVETEESYLAMADNLATGKHGKREFANDYISRGWDYVGLTGKYRLRNVTGSFFDNLADADDVTAYLHFRRYTGGMLQGDIEELYDWEPDREITGRDQVSGISLMLKLENKTRVLVRNWFTGYKFSLTYLTGLKDTFDYSTVRVEVLTNFADLPVILRISKGYESDLAQYYKRVESISIGFELRTF